MNNQATTEKMKEMKLGGMYRAFKETFESSLHESLTADELIAHLIDAEWDWRYNRKLERLIKKASFRYRARMEEIDFSSGRNIDKNTLIRLSGCEWINKAENLIITGATGAGTWCAPASPATAWRRWKKSTWKCARRFCMQAGRSFTTSPA